jgi:pimeloyl-ACP methyl ester carboxylesterase
LRTYLILAILLSAGCAVRQPAAENWRLKTNLLIPPGVSNPDLAKRTLAMDLAAGHGVCPPEIRVKANRVFVTVTRDMLDHQDQGWLTNWAARVEAQGCIAPGEGERLAAQIAESLPLDPAVAFHLLYPNNRQSGQVDLAPPVRLQVVSPILKDKAAPILEEAPETSADARGLTLAVKSSDNLIGYETDWYSVQPKAAGAGYSIAPLYAERRLKDETERRAQPDVNYLTFPSGAGFYRLVYKSDQTSFTALVIAGSTREELDRRVRLIESGAESCSELCVAISRPEAINAMLAVNVNGQDAMVNWGANVAEAIRNAGVREPESVLPHLSVGKLHNGRLAEVEFDRASPAILNLILTGGETISWDHTPAPPPQGQLVDVGGYRLHLNCAGSGSPAVFVIGGFSFDWALVQPAVASFTRVCTYDASGNAWSERGPTPTCANRVEEIHRLLRNAKIDGPYVLAGFSTGALFARLYAKNYPDEVAAMVFIDHAYLPPPVTPTSTERAAGPDSPPSVISAAPISVGPEDEPGFSRLPQQARDLRRWAMYRNPALPDPAMAEACAAEVGNSTAGNLPLVVVSTANDSPGYVKLQKNLLALSANSSQLIAAGSFHSIEISRPDVVVKAIRRTVEASRK